MEQFFSGCAIVFEGAEALVDSSKDIVSRNRAGRRCGNGRDKRGMEVVEIVVVP